ncbi:PREDICTED: protein SAR DEFICIENT 1-like [Nicotiana attenuata]|uniref:protein SAR DEFICIENT 1-like n=1 Tax=Nicotiana attenuata TaxID=49451 RepID=UPI0009049CD5|nr:PREDICTED: protein SAR DEFICIENT 1-like [Nicotiana attenuata]
MIQRINLFLPLSLSLHPSVQEAPSSISYNEVWRLEKIGKEGAFHRRLSKERVNTVKDFLTLLYLDPTMLRNVLGTGMSTKMWEVTVNMLERAYLIRKCTCTTHLDLIWICTKKLAWFLTSLDK